MATDSIAYRIDPDAASVGVGSSTALRLLGQGADGTWSDASAEYWHSSDESVVTVGQAGAVTGVSAGQATVTAVVDSQTNTAAFAEVMVTGGGDVFVGVVAYFIDPDAPSVGVGSSTALRLLAQGADGKLSDARAEYWYGSDESVVTVDEAGAVTGVSAGQATVTAVVDSQTNTAAFAEVAVTGDNDTASI